MRALIYSISLMLFAGIATAQDKPNTILVMDGSGSMWGQIDGVAKITIAQQVVTDLLETLPEDQRLGLIAYGHRERGNCTDIETLVAPGSGTRAAIADAVNGIKPLGKTPMTDSVIAAAEALRYTEDSATVILVSDGVETCNPDPCAAARLLEEAGIDFTAHVIGFDVTGDAEALTQMQCIAAETGGQFLTASNATELGAALNTVVEDPEPITVSGVFRATDETPGGAILTDQFIWDVASDTDVIFDDQEGNPLEAVLPPGDYTATAYRVVDELELSTTFTVTGTTDSIVAIPFPRIIPKAALDAPESAPGGSTVMVSWTGPDENLDNVQVVLGNGRYFDYTYTRDGNPVPIILPVQPGTYELRYVFKDRETIATRPITVTEIDLGLDAPDSVPVGSQFQVGWTGPDAHLDNVQIGPVGGGYSNYSYTERGNPVTLTAPADPGTYELRYVFLDRETIFTRPIDVTDVKAQLIAPDSVPAGSTVSVGWDGPDYDGDYISIGQTGENYIKFTYTREGNPVDILMPTEPGDYELRYQLREGNEIIATRAITLTPIDATLQAPQDAVAGGTISVTWTGPDYRNDYIGIGEIGANSTDAWENFFYTRDGSPADLVVPTDPGEYVISYFLGQDRSVLASVPITITEVGASLSLPDTAVAGSTVPVTWQGPDYRNDYIGIGEVGARSNDRWDNFFYTRDGSPGELVIPTAPGDYLVSYFVGQDRSILTTVPMTITPVKASVTAPAEAIAGETVSILWDGPDYRNDYIGIGEVGARSNDRWDNFFYTRDGTPGELVIPTKPGSYQISYFMGQDRSILFTTPIEVTAVKAQLLAPGTASAGSDLVIGWDGPDYRNDYIGIGRVDADGNKMWESFSYTRNGNPVTVTVPEDKGDYLIRYFLGQDRSVIASMPLIVD